MKFKYLFFMLLMAALILSSSAAWSETRIAAVNMNKLLNEAPQTKSADSELKSRFSKRQKALLEAQKKLREQEENYRKNKDIVSAAEKEKMESELRDKIREFKRKSESFAEDYGLARNKVLGSLQSDVYRAIVAVAKREHYDLVVSESVLYASDRIDITDKVLQELKKLPAK